MKINRRIALYLSLPVFATSLPVANLFSNTFSQAQSAQQAAPEPTAAEMSKKETVASALLRGL